MIKMYHCKSQTCPVRQFCSRSTQAKPEVMDGIRDFTDICANNEYEHFRRDRDVLIKHQLEPVAQKIMADLCEIDNGVKYFKVMDEKAVKNMKRTDFHEYPDKKLQCAKRKAAMALC